MGDDAKQSRSDEITDGGAILKLYFDDLAPNCLKCWVDLSDLEIKNGMLLFPIEGLEFDAQLRAGLRALRKLGEVCPEF